MYTDVLTVNVCVALWFGGGTCQLVFCFFATTPSCGVEETCNVTRTQEKHDQLLVVYTVVPQEHV